MVCVYCFILCVYVDLVKVRKEGK